MSQVHWPNRGFCLLDLVVYRLLKCAKSWQTCVCECMRVWWMWRVAWDSLWFTGKGFVWPTRLIGPDCWEWESQTVAFPNVAVCLHGCSPGNETWEFEQGSTNHFITAIIAALSAVAHWKVRSYENNVCLFLRQLWFHLSRRVYLTLSLRVFHIVMHIILDKCSCVSLRLSVQSCTVKIVKLSIFAVLSFKIWPSSFLQKHTRTKTHRPGHTLSFFFSPHCPVGWCWVSPSTANLPSTNDAIGCLSK